MVERPCEVVVAVGVGGRGGCTAENAGPEGDLVRLASNDGAHEVAADYGERALGAGDVERLARGMGGDADLASGTADGQERHEGWSLRRDVRRVHQRGVDLVADDDGTVIVGHLGQGDEILARMHEAERIVRMAQQDCACPCSEFRADRVEIEAVAGGTRGVCDEGSLDECSAGFRDEFEERRVHRRRDDHSVAG